MSHNGQPEYYTLTSICQFDGSPTQLGIFENMTAVTARLQSCYTSCGDEYRIECFHLATEEAETERWLDLKRQRAEAKAKNELPPSPPDPVEIKADENMDYEDGGTMDDGILRGY